MYPIDLNATYLELPDNGEKTIVLCTGPVGTRRNLRFQHFALRMQQAFPGKVVAWFANSVEPDFDPGAAVEILTERYFKTRSLMLRTLRHFLAVNNLKWRRLPFKLDRSVSDLLSKLRRTRRSVAMRYHEENLIRMELEQLKKEVPSMLQPIAVDKLGGWRSSPVQSKIKQYDPYILASMGCSLLPGSILDIVRGVPLNLHGGWSPELRGSRTIEWALYYRSLNLIGATVHVTTTGVDAGPIVRRTWPALNGDDDFMAIFLRVATSGVELMLDVIQEIFQGDRLLTFPQGTGGQLKLVAEYSSDIDVRITADEKTGWLRESLEKSMAFLSIN